MIKKKILIGALCGVVAVAVAGVAILNSQNGAKGSLVTTSTLNPTTLSNEVSLTGTVESETGRKIYSTLNYSITEVNVKEGDVVKKGELLAQLDSESLQYDIAQQVATIDLQKRQSAHQIEMSNKAYENAKKDYENDLNSQALTADQSVISAQTQLDNAQLQVDNARENYRISKDQSLGNLRDAEDRLNTAEKNLNDAKNAYNDAVNAAPGTIAELEKNFAPVKKEFDAKAATYASDLAKVEAEIVEIQKALAIKKADLAAEKDPAKIEGISSAIKSLNEELYFKQEHKTGLTYEFSLIQDAFTKQQTAKNQAVSSAQSAAGSASAGIASAEGGVTSAEAAYNQAVDMAYSASLAQMQQSIESAKRAADSAADSAENAKRLKEATHNAIQEQIDNAKDALTSAQLSAENAQVQEIAIQKLQSTLDDTQITAPTDGTITAVYAKVGQPGSGLMFVIEDTNSLKVKTKVKEYDLTKVKEGMPVIIKSDGTGDKEIKGVVSSIAPVAIKTEDGSVQSGTTVEFETIVQVTEENSGLRIGMTARLNVLVEEKKDVFSVPYDSLTQNAAGADVVYSVLPAPLAEGEKAAKEGKEKYVVHEIPVKIGMETDLYIQIISDELASGMSLVSAASPMQEGQAVIPDFAIGLVPGASKPQQTGMAAAVMVG